MSEIKNVDEFALALTKLTPKQFAGLAQFLGVHLLTDKIDPNTHKAAPREASDILSDVLDSFATLNHRDRRDLVKLLQREARRGAKHGTSANH